MRHAFVIAALLLSGCLATGDEPTVTWSEVAETGEPLVTYGPPASWGGGSVRWFAGKWSTNSEIVMVYQQGLTGGGTCSTPITIGDEGVLFERTRINGTSADDEMLVVAPSEMRSPCVGIGLAPVTTSIKLELYPGGGDDVVRARGVNANLIVEGGAGADSVLVGSAFSAVGGIDVVGAAGNVMISEASDATMTFLAGGSNSDTLCAFVPTIMDGSAGSDVWWGPGSENFVSHMEGTTTESACIAKRTTIINRGND